MCAHVHVCVCARVHVCVCICPSLSGGTLGSVVREQEISGHPSHLPTQSSLKPKSFISPQRTMISEKATSKKHYLLSNQGLCQQWATLEAVRMASTLDTVSDQHDE